MTFVWYHAHPLTLLKKTKKNLTNEFTSLFKRKYRALYIFMSMEWSRWLTRAPIPYLPLSCISYTKNKTEFRTNFFPLFSLLFCSHLSSHQLKNVWCCSNNQNERMTKYSFVTFLKATRRRPIHYLFTTSVHQHRTFVLSSLWSYFRADELIWQKEEEELSVESLSCLVHFTNKWSPPFLTCSTKKGRFIYAVWISRIHLYLQSPESTKRKKEHKKRRKQKWSLSTALSTWWV